MPKNEPVSNLDSWYFFFPFFPIWIWAYWRIEALRRGGVSVTLGAWVLNTSLNFVLPFPWGLVITICGTPWVAWFCHRKWAKDWNSKFKSEK